MLKYVEKPPEPSLRRFLECFWCVSDDRSRRVRQPERVVPDGCPELIVHLGDPFSRLVRGRWRRQPRVFLAGALSRPWTLRPGPRVLTMGIRFRPGRAAELFDRRMDASADTEWPLADLAGRAPARAIERALRDAGSENERFVAASDWLSARLQAARPHHAASALVPIDRVLKARGQVRIEALAQELQWTPRRLERAFLRDLGIRPKLFARIVRLNHVLARLGQDERAAAVDVALDAGYFDQAHLLRDFRRLAGRTPRAGARSDGEIARHFTRPERLRALLAAE